MRDFDSGQIAILDNLISKMSEEIDLVRYRNSKILITGASGHLGKWLTLLFSHESATSHDIQIMVETSRSDSIKSLCSKLKLRIPSVLHPNGSHEKFDVIFDMSLPQVDVNDRENYGPIFEFLRNFIKQRNRVNNGGILVIPSSGAVYGSVYKNPQGFIEEDAAYSEKRNTYGEAKLLIENLSHQIDFLSLPIFRIFSVFGPLMRHDSPLIGNNFFVQCQEKGRIALNGQGLPRRNMSFVTDIITQMVSLAPAIDQTNGPINLGTDNNLSIKEFAILVANSMSSIVVTGVEDEKPQAYIPILDKLSSHKLGSGLDVAQAVEITRNFYR